MTATTLDTPVIISGSYQVITDNFTLGAKDRCDTCQAGAYYRVIMSGGYDLLFCNHHFKKNETGLARAGFKKIIDESARLVEDAK